MKPESSQWYPVRGQEAVAQVEKQEILFKLKKKLSSYKGGQTLEKVAQRPILKILKTHMRTACSPCFEQIRWSR